MGRKTQNRPSNATSKEQFKPHITVHTFKLGLKFYLPRPLLVKNPFTNFYNFTTKHTCLLPFYLQAQPVLSKHNSTNFFYITESSKHVHFYKALHQTL